MTAASIATPGTSVPPSNVQPASVSGIQAFPEGEVRVMLEVVENPYMRYLPHFRRRFHLLLNPFPRNAKPKMPPLTRRGQGSPREQLESFARWIVPLMPRASLRAIFWVVVLRRSRLKRKKAEAKQAKLKVEGDLKFASDSLKTLEKEKNLEIERRKDREAKLDLEIRDLRKMASDEKARADKAEASLAESERSR
ncbi:hypothetical protein PIB30_073992 [Stylosanthes scabra]|uniref:Uncharacterized protein n=1 Tax=Stylosanthes scabra TaxID=79078 RepID=A0ABU6UP11_9FABA|nr:hypothetical protein [Stylosanthes scabra]